MEIQFEALSNLKPNSKVLKKKKDLKNVNYYLDRKKEQMDALCSDT